MYRVCYHLSAISPDMPDAFLCDSVAAAVMGLALHNQVILRWYNMPSIYTLRPRYFTPKVERWKDIVDVMKDRRGDCKDLVAWRLAELWKQGVPCGAECSVDRDTDGFLLFHTYIRYPNGAIEDPSKELGMKV